ncbi:hypothetical protein CC99x_005745 [Candidatus Berkiella cookevillensis]|uniref:Uncharacterized protein n=1 Tax=Candidatus Berkiella cookevillensis TaxID=437022 RepID=A0A0Q9YHH3_9GAMM|nr:hypothetical protein [Candidatus Berkiella cookevillensis]MCS5708406.1 hypothetical protein [Candidatus Berkiella cookevillensis]
MLEFTMPFSNSRELCIGAKNHCTSVIHQLLKKPDGNLQLLTPSLLAPFTEAKLPLEYAIHGTKIHRAEFQSTIEMDKHQSFVDRIAPQEIDKNLLLGHDARERIAHEVISLLAMKTVNAIQQMLYDSEHAPNAHQALAKLLSITDFCFDSIREKMQESLKQCSEIAENLRMIEASTSPVFTSLYDGIAQDQDIAASSDPAAAPEDECVKDTNTLKLIPKP